MIVVYYRPTSVEQTRNTFMLYALYPMRLTNEQLRVKDLPKDPAVAVVEFELTTLRSVA